MACKHSFLEHNSTCSIDMKTFYCVNCLWEKTEKLTSEIINIEKLTDINTIDWDGITVKHIFSEKNIMNKSYNKEVKNIENAY